MLRASWPPARSRPELRVADGHPAATPVPDRRAGGQDAKRKGKGKGWMVNDETSRVALVRERPFDFLTLMFGLDV